jgi:RNA polymerase sigma-70 factor (ECF subfamily)
MFDEEKLIKKIQKYKDKNAANILVDMYYREIYIYIYKQTTNSDITMDLTQETFINMLKNINSYNKKKSAFRTWAYKIATYKVIDYYRSKHYKQSKLYVSMDNYEIHSDLNLTIDYEKKEDIEKILKILSRFDETAQKIFRLKIFAERTFLEISKILKIPESTIKTNFYATQKKIKMLFMKECKM